MAVGLVPSAVKPPRDRRAPRAAHQAMDAVAGPGPVPARRGRGDLAAVGRPRLADAGRGRHRRRPVRVVHPLFGGVGGAREPAGPRHHRDERAARHQPDVEHITAAPGRAADPGDPAGRGADQPDPAAHAGLRRIGGGDVLGAAALGRPDRPRGARRGGVRVLPGPDRGGDRPLPPRVRGAAAAADRRPAAHRHRPRPPPSRPGSGWACWPRRSSSSGKNSWWIRPWPPSSCSSWWP